VRRDLIAHASLQFLEDLDESFDAVLLVGAHTRFGNPRGIISHTITRPFAHVSVNGERIDEVKPATSMAAHMGVPVGLVTGDDAICARKPKRGSLKWRRRWLSMRWIPSVPSVSRKKKRTIGSTKLRRERWKTPPALSLLYSPLPLDWRLSC
jgi:hypothetical protein